MRKDNLTRQGVRNLDRIGPTPKKPRTDLRQQVCGHLRIWHQDLGAGRKSRNCDDCGMYEEIEPTTEESCSHERTTTSQHHRRV